MSNNTETIDKESIERYLTEYLGEDINNDPEYESLTQGIADLGNVKYSPNQDLEDKYKTETADNLTTYKTGAADIDNTYKVADAEEQAKIAKREKANAIASAIGDGLTALANIWGTAKGARPFQQTPLSGVWLQRRDKLQAEGVKNATMRREGYKLLEQQYRDRQKGIEKRYNDALKADYKAFADDRALKFNIKKEQLADFMKRKGMSEKQIANALRLYGIMVGDENAKARNAEQARHNIANESNGRERNNIAAGNAEDNKKGDWDLGVVQIPGKIKDNGTALYRIVQGMRAAYNADTNLQKMAPGFAELFKGFDTDDNRVDVDAAELRKHECIKIIRNACSGSYGVKGFSKRMGEIIKQEMITAGYIKK